MSRGPSLGAVMSNLIHWSLSEPFPQVGVMQTVRSARHWVIHSHKHCHNTLTFTFSEFLYTMLEDDLPGATLQRS